MQPPGERLGAVEQLEAALELGRVDEAEDEVELVRSRSVTRDLLPPNADDRSMLPASG
jgi:hypothetical protein